MKIDLFDLMLPFKIPYKIYFQTEILSLLWELIEGGGVLTVLDEEIPRRIASWQIL